MVVYNGCTRGLIYQKFCQGLTGDKIGAIQTAKHAVFFFLEIMPAQWLNGD
jgi:cobalamin synthase